MFALPGLTKLVVLIAIIVVVWYGFKLLGQVDRARKEAQRAQRTQAARRQAPPPPEQVVEDMVKCSKCGAYVTARRPTRCSRGDCPW
jgi:hypothetical protein